MTKIRSLTKQQKKKTFLKYQAEILELKTAVMELRNSESFKKKLDQAEDIVRKLKTGCLKSIRGTKRTK